jgi:hypothetical protein
LYDVYSELCEFVHTRFEPLRTDCPERKKQVISQAEFDAMDRGVKRLPSELERRFMDILYLIASDWWLVPSGAQWVEILA